MTWQVLILTHNVLSAVFIVLQRRLAVTYKKRYSLQITAIINCWVAVVGVLWAIVAPEKINFYGAIEYWYWFILAGILFFLSAYVHFLTYRYVDAAVGAILNLLSTIGIIFCAWVFLGEKLQGYDLLGAGLVMAAVVILFVSHQKHKKHRSNFFYGFLYAALGAVTLGAAVTIEKYLVDRIGAVSYVPLGFSVQSIFLVLFALKGSKGFFKTLSRKSLISATTAGLLRAGAGLAFLISLTRSSNTAVLGALGGVKVVIVAVLGVLILKEHKMILRKTLATVVAVSGIFILFA